MKIRIYMKSGNSIPVSAYDFTYTVDKSKNVQNISWEGLQTNIQFLILSDIEAIVIEEKL
jgi:hypothetical protein